jgi:hypothetical protein
LLMLVLAFASPHKGVNMPVIGIGNALLDWLLAWPFVIKRVLAPEVVLAKPASLSRGFRVRYGVAVTLGVVSDLASLVPIAAVVLSSRLLGLATPYAIALMIFFSTRLFVVLPFGIRALFGRLPELA